MKLTENMVAVLKVLADMPEGKAFARAVLADERLKGKTFNGVNATLAAADGAVIIGFNVRADGPARQVIDSELWIFTTIALFTI